MNIIKKILPMRIINLVTKKYIERPIYNVCNRSGKRKVLISYITKPFKSKSFSHTNFYTANVIAKIFDEIGYVVDVMNYNAQIPDLRDYEVIYGFGDVFQKYFESGVDRKKTIYYGTGMHVCHQNEISLERVRSVYRKKGVWLARSARFVEKTWTHQTSLVDGIIALGNEKCAQTYRRHFDGKIYSLPNTYFQILDPNSILSVRRRSANKSYLWFGSSGLIHKGLDLCLDFFKSRTDLTLHICGNIYSEPWFIKAYHRELFETPNIIAHGFVNIEDEKFSKILEDCSFLIFPSCSEGGSPSVLTTVGNGALIPIISSECSVSTGSQIWIDGFTVEALAQAVDYSQSLSSEEIYELQKMNLKYVQEENSQVKFYERLKVAVEEVIS